MNSDRSDELLKAIATVRRLCPDMRFGQMLATLNLLGEDMTERNFWDGIIRDDYTILRVLADNSGKTPAVKKALPRIPATALEVGVGPLGLGILGFLPEIEHRFAIDPQPPISLGARGSNALRDFILTRRVPVHYAVGCGGT